MKRSITNLLERNGLKATEKKLLTNLEDGYNIFYTITSPDVFNNCYMVTIGLADYLLSLHLQGIAYEVAIKLTKDILTDSNKIEASKKELEYITLDILDKYEYTEDYTYYTISALSKYCDMNFYTGYIFTAMFKDTNDEPKLLLALPLVDEEITAIWANDIKPEIGERVMLKMYPNFMKTSDFCIDKLRKIDIEKFDTLIDQEIDDLPIEDSCYMYMFDATESKKYKSKYDKCMAYLKGEF